MVKKVVICSKANKNFIIIGLVLACLAGLFHLAGNNLIKTRIHQVKVLKIVKRLIERFV